MVAKQAWILASLVSSGLGCAASDESYEGAAYSEPDVGEAASPVLIEYRGGRGSAPHSPCYSVAVFEVDGMRIEVPVACAEFWIDKGDPPPDRLRRLREMRELPRPPE